MSESNDTQPTSGEKSTASQGSGKSQNRNRNRSRRPRNGGPKSNERDARKNKGGNTEGGDSPNGEKKSSNQNRNRNRNRSRNRSKNGNNNSSNREGDAKRETGQKRGQRKPQGKKPSGNRNKNNSSRPKKKPETAEKPGFIDRILIALGLKKPTTHAPKTPRQKEIRRRTQEEATRQKKIESGEINETPPVPKEKKTNKLYIGNLSYDVTEQDISELFRGVGKVRSVDIIYNGKTHRSKGFGFIKMNTAEDAELAIEILDDQFFMGRKMQLKPAEQNQQAEANQAEAAEATASKES